MAEERQLSAEEKRYLLHVERGNVAQVSSMLQLYRNQKQYQPGPGSMDEVEGGGSFDMNCVDPVGRSALVVAIENENMDLIKLLLDAGVEMKDSLLRAIEEEYVEAVEFLLDHEERTRQAWKPRSWETVDGDVATYTPDITPLVLAAHKNNFEILKLLLERGARLPSPHDVKCGCGECVTSHMEDSLRHSRARINAYSALVSPALIALTSADPILTAFELSRELRRLSVAETEFKQEYQDLRSRVEEFATGLLNFARNSSELSVILNHDPQAPQDQEGDRMSLARLKMAIQYEQKTFVAHSNVQQLLASVWYDGMPGFRRKSKAAQLAEVARLAMLYPVHCVVYICAPSTHYGQRTRRPFVKFINHSTSYCFFLSLLVMVSQRVESWVWSMFGDSNDIDATSYSGDPSVERGALPGFVESAVVVYVFGFVWAEWKQFYQEGLRGYINDMWNTVDLITCALYLTWIALRTVAWIQVRQEWTGGQPVTIPREMWDDFDPMFISEGIFGAANICSFLKMVHIFSVNQHLGPLQISLGRMVFDILKFFFIYSLVLFAFGCGMNQLLWYNSDVDRRRCYSLPNQPLLPNPKEENSCDIWRRFANLFETSQSLFWASFGLVDLKSFELTGIKMFTRFWGLLMYGAYCVINVVVLLNLLIAMMNHSYQFISEKSDTEWKFARSKLWMSYFEDGGTLPSPFNIIPTPKSIMRLFGFQGTRERVSIKKVMSSLVRRYVTREQYKREEHGVTEDDVNEIKQNITTFRYELVDMLRKNNTESTSADTATAETPKSNRDSTSFADSDKSLDAGDDDLSSSNVCSKKERTKERRLLKGFNVGVVPNCLPESPTDGNTVSSQGGPANTNGSSGSIFSIFSRLGGGPRVSGTNRNWNFIMAAAADRLRRTESGKQIPSDGGQRGPGPAGEWRLNVDPGADLGVGVDGSGMVDPNGEARLDPGVGFYEPGPPIRVVTPFGRRLLDLAKELREREANAASEAIGSEDFTETLPPQVEPADTEAAKPIVTSQLSVALLLTEENENESRDKEKVDAISHQTAKAAVSRRPDTRFGWL